MENKTRSSVISVILTSSLLLAACGSGEEELREFEVDETRPVAELPEEGDISVDYTTPPPLQDEAFNSLDDVSVDSIADTYADRALVVSDDGQQLHRIDNGSYQWSSEVQENRGEFVTASFVHDLDRTWVVAVYDDGDDGMTVVVFDSESHAEDQEALRIETFSSAESIVTNRHGVLVYTDDSDIEYLPSTGLMSNINVPSDASLQSLSRDGYLLKDDGNISLAAEEESGVTGWNGRDHLPTGFTEDAESTLIGIGDSYIALQWEEDDSEVVTINSSANGAIIAEGDHDETFEFSRTRLKGSPNEPYLYADNYVVDVSNEEIIFFNEDVVGVADNIAYLADGSGYSVESEDLVWRSTDQDIAVNSFVQRTAFFIDDNDLFLHRLKFDRNPVEDIEEEEELEENDDID